MSRIEKDECKSREIPTDFQKIKVLVTSEGKTEEYEGEYVLVVTLNKDDGGIQAESVGSGIMGLDYAMALGETMKKTVDSATKQSIEAVVKGIFGGRQ